MIGVASQYMVFYYPQCSAAGAVKRVIICYKHGTLTRRRVSGDITTNICGSGYNTTISGVETSSWCDVVLFR